MAQSRVVEVPRPLPAPPRQPMRLCLGSEQQTLHGTARLPARARPDSTGASARSCPRGFAHTGSAGARFRQPRLCWPESEAQTKRLSESALRAARREPWGAGGLRAPEQRSQSPPAVGASPPPRRLRVAPDRAEESSQNYHADSPFAIFPVVWLPVTNIIQQQ